MKHAIFTKGKDGFLYQNVNLIDTGIGFYDIGDGLSIKQLLYSIKMGYIEYGDDKLETIEDFDKKYVILFEL